MSIIQRPIQGVGIGLRTCHFEYILTHQPDVSWFEAITENYLNQGERAMHHLLSVREHYPITLHGVSLSIGSSDPLNKEYLQSLKELASIVEPSYISDHLCWTSLHNRYVPDLLPLPYTQETLSHVAERISRVQDVLGRQILIENVSSYLEFEDSCMHEWEFLSQVAQKADCLILLDINNIYVSAHNHQFDPVNFFSVIPIERVKEMHLGGFEEHGTHFIDTHGAMVSDEVWDLYAKAISHFGQVPTLMEWDNNIPAFEVLLEQQGKAVETREQFNVNA